MHFRSPTGRIFLSLALALSLTMGSVAAIAAVAANTPSIASNAALGAPVPALHTGGMLHGQDSRGGSLARVLCLFACMGLTATPSLPSLDVVPALASFVMQSHIVGRDAGDQILTRPTSPPPRVFATI